MTQAESHAKKLAAIGFEDYDLEHVTSFSFPPKDVFAVTKHIATSSVDKTVRIWNIETEVLGATLQHDSEVSAVLFSPDGKTLASVSADRKVRLWRTNSVKAYIEIPLLEARAKAVVFSPPSGKYLASVPMDSSAIQIWSTESGVLMRTVNVKDVVSQEAVFKELAFSSDGRYFASICKDDNENYNYETSAFSPMSERVFLFDTETGHALSLAESTASVKNRNEIHFENLTFAPTGSILAAVAGSAISLWDAEADGDKVGELDESYASRLIFSPFGEYLACTVQDLYVHIWNIEREELVKSIDIVGSVAAFSPNGRYFALISHDVALEIMHAFKSSFLGVDGDWARAERMRRFPPTSGDIAIEQIALDGIVFTPDSRKVALFKKNKLLRFVSPIDFRDLTNKAIALLPMHLPPYVMLEVLNRDLTEKHQSLFEHESNFYHFEKVSAIEALQKSYKGVVKERDAKLHKKRF